MSEIIQGDSGTVIEATISDDNGVVDIRGGSVEFVIKTSTKRIIKQGTITDGLNGICQFVLNSEDVQDIGNYAFQGTVIFPSGKKFSSDIHKFKVGQKL